MQRSPLACIPERRARKPLTDCIPDMTFSSGVVLHPSTSPEAVRAAQVEAVVEARASLPADATEAEIADAACLPLWNTRRALVALGLATADAKKQVTEGVEKRIEVIARYLIAHGPATIEAVRSGTGLAKTFVQRAVSQPWFFGKTANKIKFANAGVEHRKGKRPRIVWSVSNPEEATK